MKYLAIALSYGIDGLDNDKNESQNPVCHDVSNLTVLTSKIALVLAVLRRYTGCVIHARTRCGHSKCYSLNGRTIKPLLGHLAWIQPIDEKQFKFPFVVPGPLRKFKLKLVNPAGKQIRAKIDPFYILINNYNKSFLPRQILSR